MVSLKSAPAALALVVAATLVAAPGSEAGSRATATETARTPADRPWAGFRIPTTKRASSGWIGARSTESGAEVYRVDPRRTRVTSRYAGRKWAARFKSSSGDRMSRRGTACAALILGKYGTRRDDLQAAGVDVATYHLLHGGRYRYDGAAQVRRTDQRDNGPLIRAFAQNLIRDYCALSGPYRVTLSSDVARAEVGGNITATVRVRSRSRTPMAGIPITITVGETGTELVTDASGTVTLTVTADRSGPLQIRTVAHNLPYAKVQYLVPRRQGASRVVVAGLKQRVGYQREAVVPVQGQPTLELDAARTVRRAAPFRGRFRLAHGYAVPREATVRIFGPFRSADNAACTPGRLARAGTVAVEGNGWYRSRSFTLRATGWYVWRVGVPGDPDYNKPVARCGRRFEVE